MYLLSIAAVFILLFVLSAVSGTSLFHAVGLFDIPALLLLLLLSIPVIVSSGCARELADAFPLALGKKRADSFAQLKRSRVAVETAMKTFVFSALFIAMFKTVLTLRTLDSLDALGPAVAYVATTLVLSFLFNLLLIPVKTRLEYREIEFIQQ